MRENVLSFVLITKYSWAAVPSAHTHTHFLLFLFVFTHTHTRKLFCFAYLLIDLLAERSLEFNKLTWKWLTIHVQRPLYVILCSTIDVFLIMGRHIHALACHHFNCVACYSTIRHSSLRIDSYTSNRYMDSLTMSMSSTT